MYFLNSNVTINYNFTGKWHFIKNVEHFTFNLLHKDMFIQILFKTNIIK